MGRNRNKAAPSRFASWEDYDAAYSVEFRRNADALDRLARRYGPEGERAKRKKTDDEKIAFMDRIDAKFEMESRRHDAAFYKLELREPETPRPGAKTDG